MKKMILTGLWFVAATFMLSGCSASGHLVERSVNKAKASKSLAKESTLDSASTANASAQLDFAKACQKTHKDELAIIAPERSALEYRLALLTAERDSLKKQDEQLEKELRSDVERKLLYQNILEQETGNKEAE